jgi:hypothetical protein
LTVPASQDRLLELLKAAEGAGGRLDLRACRELARYLERKGRSHTQDLAGLARDLRLAIAWVEEGGVWLPWWLALGQKRRWQACRQGRAWRQACAELAIEVLRDHLHDQVCRRLVEWGLLACTVFRCERCDRRFVSGCTTYARHFCSHRCRLPDAHRAVGQGGRPLNLKEITS